MNKLFAKRVLSEVAHTEYYDINYDKGAVFMIIIPYVRPGCLDSNTLRHFNTIGEAVEWAFNDMYTQPDNTDTIQKRFRIINTVDTEEDFTVSLSKKDGDIIAPIGWMGLCGNGNLK